MTTRKNKSSLLLSDPSHPEVEKQSAVSKRTEFMESEEHRSRHLPAANNSLRIKLDQLKSFDALTPNQQLFFDAYKRGDYFIGLLGSAGVGKTFIAMYKALEEVLDKTNSFKRVVIVRSAVQTRDQGFMPGSIDEKQEIYEAPYKEISATLFDRSDAYDRLKEGGYVRFITTTAIRGISIDDAVIIVDESQSMGLHELSTVMSRTGYRSKIIFCGDWKQNDLVKSKYDVTGLPEFLKIARNMNEFTEIHFTTEDIVRSSLVKSFIISCEQMGY